MVKQFLLILITFANSEQVQVEAPLHPLAVFQSRDRCEEIGARMVESSVAEIEGMGGTMGSAWYYCQRVDGQAVGH